MDIREKLIEILEDPCGGRYPACELADYLIDSGVTVQECKLGVKKTNADRIRAMTDVELNDLFHDIYDSGAYDAVSYGCGHQTNSFEWTIDWLQQPAKEVNNG